MYCARILLNMHPQSKSIAFLLNTPRRLGQNVIMASIVSQNNCSSMSKKTILFTNILTENKLLHNCRRWASNDNNFVSYNELNEIKDSSDVVVIDVRTREETGRTGTIPGSLCVPLNELVMALNMSTEEFQETYCKKKPNKSDHLVFLCHKGERSYEAMEKAKEIGYQKSKSYQGGFLGWFEEERLKRERDDGSEK